MTVTELLHPVARLQEPRTSQSRTSMDTVVNRTGAHHQVQGGRAVELTAVRLVTLMWIGLIGEQYQLYMGLRVLNETRTPFRSTETTQYGTRTYDELV
jgi:hypothetical protein